VVLITNLIQSVLSLPELRLRRDWLLVHLRAMATADSAALLDALCKSSERGDPAAREAMTAWVAGLVQLGDCPWVMELRRRSVDEDLLSINRLLLAYAPVSIVPGTAAAVPDYGAGRELTVGERRSLARKPNRRAFEKLLHDPHPLVLRNLLQNPRLTEDDVLRLVAKRPLRSFVVDELVTFPEWLLRPRVRMTLLHNPGTFAHVAMPLLSLCKRDELAEIFENTSLNGVLRSAARELLDRRPPLGIVSTPTFH
jgi:hypothetical protein